MVTQTLEIVKQPLENRLAFHAIRLKSNNFYDNSGF